MENLGFFVWTLDFTQTFLIPYTLVQKYFVYPFTLKKYLPLKNYRQEIIIHKLPIFSDFFENRLTNEQKRDGLRNLVLKMFKNKV